MEVTSPDKYLESLRKDIEGVLKQPPARPLEKLGFASTRGLRSALTPGRQLLVRVIRRKQPHSVYALAKMLGRDRKTISEDLQVLARFGLVKFVKKRIGGRRCVVPHVPYDEIEIRVKI